MNGIPIIPARQAFVRRAGIFGIYALTGSLCAGLLDAEFGLLLVHLFQGALAFFFGHGGRVACGRLAVAR